MKIFVNAKPNSKENSIRKMDETHFSVRLTAPPSEGKANQLLIELLAGYFQRPKNSIQIISGHSSKQKVLEIS